MTNSDIVVILVVFGVVVVGFVGWDLLKRYLAKRVAPVDPLFGAHSGESIDEMIARAETERIDSVVVAIVSAIERKPKESWTELEANVIAIERLEDAVNGGGFATFSQVYGREYASRYASGLEMIGCPQMASIVVEALAAIGCDRSAPEEAIEKAMESATDEQLDQLSLLDKKFMAYPEPITERLFAFLVAHAEKVKIP